MTGAVHEAYDAYSIRSTWSCYWLDEFPALALHVKIFNISLDLSSINFAHFSGCWASSVYSCHSVLECYNLFSGVKLSGRSFCFICGILALLHEFENICYYFHGLMIDFSILPILMDFIEAALRQHVYLLEYFWAPCPSDGSYHSRNFTFFFSETIMDRSGNRFVWIIYSLTVAWELIRLVRPWADQNLSDFIQMTPSIVLRTMKLMVWIQ